MENSEQNAPGATSRGIPLDVWAVLLALALAALVKLGWFPAITW